MKRKINVIHVRNCRGKGGGPEKTLLFSMQRIDRRAFNMVLVYLKSHDDCEFDIDKRAQEIGVELIVIDEKYKLDITALRKLFSLLKREKIDIFHGHGYKSNIYGLILACFYRMKLITTTHGWASREMKVRLYDWLDRKILRCFRRVLIVTEAMRDVLVKNSVNPKRISVVWNAIDVAHFRKAPLDRTVLGQLAIPEGSRLIGAISRLDREKDYPTLFGAAQEVVAKRQDTHFLIVGKGPQETQLKQQVVEMGLAERIHFTGHIRDVRAIFNLLDIYILTSITEGLPNTVLEAMAMEVPIIATPVGGVTELVRDHKEAILVPVGDCQRIAQEILQLLENTQLQQKLTQAARTRVENEFDFSRRMRKIENIYRELL